MRLCVQRREQSIRSSEEQTGSTLSQARGREKKKVGGVWGIPKQLKELQFADSFFLFFGLERKGGKIFAQTPQPNSSDGRRNQIDLSAEPTMEKKTKQGGEERDGREHRRSIKLKKQNLSLSSC